MARSYAGLGAVEGRRNNLSESSTYLLKALALFEELGDEHGMSLVYLRMGVVNAMLRNRDAALTNFSRALPYAIDNDPYNVITIYNNMGNILLDMGEFDKGVDYYEKAHNLAEKHDFEDLRVLSLSNLALIFKREGDLRLALQYFDEAIALTEKYHLEEENIVIRIQKLRAIADRNPATVVSGLEELFQTADSLKIFYASELALDELVELHKVLGNSSKVIEMMEKREKVREILYDESKALEIRNLQALYDLDKSKENLQALEKEISQQGKERIYIGIIFLMLVGGLIAAMYLNKKKRKINVDLKIREDELEIANHVKNRILSIIGHDVTGALASQSVGIELLESGVQDKETEGLILKGLRKNLNDALYILTTLLNWGKLQIKGVYLQTSRFDIHGIIEKKINLIEISAKMKDLIVINNVPEDTEVTADEDQIRFVIRNLLTNAVKYSLRGGTITIGIVEDGNHSKQIFFVRDQGVGIDEEDKPLLFEPFHVSRKGTNDESGNSLALLISKEFIALNHGRIWFESNTGPGTTFFVELPK